MFEHIHALSILVSAILAVAVGSIWYSPLLFGATWAKSVGISMEEGDMTKKDLLIATIKAVLVQTVFFVVVAQFIIVSQSGALSLANIGSLLTVLCIMYMSHMVIWEKRPLSYVLVNAGYTAIVVFGGIGIIAYWPW